MNMRLLLSTLNNRIRSKEFKPISVNNVLFFQNKTEWITDILLIGTMWDNVNYQDQLCICRHLIGIRYRQDLMLLLRWINESKDIDNFILMVELDTKGS